VGVAVGDLLGYEVGNSVVSSKRRLEGLVGVGKGVGKRVGIEVGYSVGYRVGLEVGKGLG
jgi:hypothetical protein